MVCRYVYGRIEKMMTKQAADTTLQKFFAQLRELERRVLVGALDPLEIRQPLQDIIAGKTFSSPHASLFKSPQAVYEAFCFRARTRKWRFTEEQLRELGNRIPFGHESSLTGAATLEIWLGNLEKTAKELWLWVAYMHPEARLYEGLRFDREHLRSIDPNRFGDKPSVGWVETNLIANRGLSPQDIRDPRTSAGLEVLTCAATHTDWAQSMDFEEVPGVYIAGVQMTYYREWPWKMTPYLSASPCGAKTNAVRLSPAHDKPEDKRGEGEWKFSYAVPETRLL